METIQQEVSDVIADCRVPPEMFDVHLEALWCLLNAYKSGKLVERYNES
jgi:hypothetical protein